VPRIDTSVSVDAIIVIVSVLIVENMISIDSTAVLLMTGEVTLVAGADRNKNRGGRNQVRDSLQRTIHEISVPTHLGKLQNCSDSTYVTVVVEVAVGVIYVLQNSLAAAVYLVSISDL
jgi:hypothetical protein